MSRHYLLNASTRAHITSYMPAFPSVIWGKDAVAGFVRVKGWSSFSFGTAANTVLDGVVGCVFLVCCAAVHTGNEYQEHQEKELYHLSCMYFVSHLHQKKVHRRCTTFGQDYRKQWEKACQMKKLLEKKWKSHFFEYSSLRYCNVLRCMGGFVYERVFSFIAGIAAVPAVVGAAASRLHF